MSQKIRTSVEIDGSLTASQIANATTDTDKFLVSDGGTVKYRTSTEILSDLGITLNTASKLQHQVKAGVAINKGQAVYVTSADGTNMIVGLASNDSEATSSKTMGLLDATVSINGFANVVTEGLLAGLDTSTATVGNPVWLGTGGNLIYGLANKPYAPNHLVFIGIVTRVNANNGEIFVKVQNGFELDEIHDVDLKTTAKVNGHLLGYNGSLWVNKTIAEWLGYTPYNASNPAGYISSYTETDTLASVTGRGATTGTSITVGGVFTTKGTNPYIQWQNSAGTRLGYIQHATNLVMSSDTGNIEFTPSSGLVKTIGYIRYGGASAYSNTGLDSNGFYQDVNGTNIYESTMRLQSNILSGVSSYNGLKFGAAAIGNASEGFTIFTGGYDNNRLTINASGNATFGVDARAPIFYDSNNTGYYVDPSSQSNLNSVYATSYSLYNGNTIWNSGNDGSGSGLDADLLDGYHASYFATSSHTHDLGRYSLRAPSVIDALTTSNFRSTLFGSSANDYNISTARFNVVPTPLNGLTSYGTMMAWAGSDTHGFISVNYDTPGAIVGGGNGENINWTKKLAFADGTSASGTWNISVSGNADTVDGEHSNVFALHRGEGRNYIDYSRYVYNNGAYSGSGWVEPSDLGVRYANSAGSAPNGSNINNYYDATSGDGFGFRFWNGSDSYKISMGYNPSLYQYGPVTDYSIKMQMNDADTGRGFTWGRLSYAPIAALNSTSGDMQIAGSFRSNKVLTHVGIAGGGQNLFTGYEGVYSANGRGQIIISSSYSDMIIASSQLNNEHGSTLTFASYNPDNKDDYRKFVINQGNWGSRKHILSFGYGDSSYTNPHSVINSGMNTLIINGLNRKVGIKVENPSYELEVSGDVYSASSRAGIFYRNTNTGYWWQPENDASHRFQTPGGYIDIGPKNGGYCHIYTDRPSFYFNQQLDVLGSRVLHAGNYSSYALPLSGGTMSGQMVAPSVGTGVYDGAIQLRETGYVLATQYDWGYAPAITFHWGNRFAKKFGARSDGQFAVDDVPIVLANGGTWSINISGNASTVGNATVNTLRGNVGANPVNFTVNGDANTYYPVLISAGGQYGFNRYSVYRGYAEAAPWDPIGTGVHHGGLTFTFDWSSDIAWGGNDKSYRVIEFNETYTTMVAGMHLPVTGGMLVWLRGGGATYHLQGPAGINHDITVYYSGYSAANGSFFGTRTSLSSVDGEIMSRYPIRGNGDGPIYVNNSKVLYEGSWINNKYFGTDGNIYASKFSDSDNGSYYVEPASTSQLNTVNISGRLAVTYDADRYQINITRAGGSNWWITNDSGALNLHQNGVGDKFTFATSGTFTATSDIVAYSDIRVKENINTIQDALNKVKALRGVTYNRTDTEDNSEKIGVIAQEIQKILPQVVHEQGDGMLGVSYGNITAVLIEAIKEQQTQIEELKELVNKLINK